MSEPTMRETLEHEEAVTRAKELRVALDGYLQKLKEYRDTLGRSDAARHASISVTAVEDAIMRLGMVLKELGTPNPYPNSYKPENTIVDPTADGLKL